MGDFVQNSQKNNFINNKLLSIDEMKGMLYNSESEIKRNKTNMGK